MSFVGGGSDLPSYYRSFGGAVLSTAIDKYVFITCNRKFDNGIRIAYSKTEEVNDLRQIEHRIVKAVMSEIGIKGGVEITTVADVPSRGTGLGSSSSFTVGLLNVLAAFKGRYTTSSLLAEQSCRVEIDMCGDPIGKQDQFAAAYGGFNLIEFHPDERVDVSPVIMSPEVRKTLERRLMVFYTGTTRRATDILEVQSRETATRPDTQNALHRMVELVYALKTELEHGNLDSFGDILHENWELKKSLAPGVSNEGIDDWYDAARRHGALGGKILGAGAGGFLIFYANEEKHKDIEKALHPLRRVTFAFEPIGSRIIFYDPTTVDPEFSCEV
jgi:D-glycero-alpha-D-manno-heptose-7-phosphate kinase